jgi:nicotinamide-nucleotide adenylyltransferase
MNRILFIGRFQPLHLGHLSIMKQAVDNCDELIIAIGSSENAYEDINPFSSSERFEMILEVLKTETFPLEKIHIIPIHDIGDDKAWVKHVQSLTPEFNEVYSGKNEGYEYIRKLFEDAGVKVKVLENTLDIDASSIREKIKNNNDSWKEMLHSNTVEYIQSIDGVKRIQKIKTHGVKRT